MHVLGFANLRRFGLRYFGLEGRGLGKLRRERLYRRASRFDHYAEYKANYAGGSVVSTKNSSTFKELTFGSLGCFGA